MAGLSLGAVKQVRCSILIVSRVLHSKAKEQKGDMIGMKSTFKKLLVSVVCVTLALAFMAVGVLADSSSSQGQRQGRPGMQQGGPGGGGQGGPGGQGGGELDLTQIKAAIAELDDDDTQDDLTELVEAYEDAIEAEKEAMTSSSSTAQDTMETLRKATADARSALVSALSEAGVETEDRGNGRNGNGQKGDNNRGDGFGFQTLDTDTIEDLIADLDSSTTKKSLTTLLEAYEDALSDEKTGLSDTSLTEDEKKALREAVTTAAQKLTEALSDAGIEQSEYTSRPDGQSQSPEAPPEQLGGDASSSVTDNVSSTSSTDKTGFFQSFLNWLGSFIK